MKFKFEYGTFWWVISGKFIPQFGVENMEFFTKIKNLFCFQNQDVPSSATLDERFQFQFRISIGENRE